MNLLVTAATLIVALLSGTVSASAAASAAPTSTIKNKSQSTVTVYMVDGGYLLNKFYKAATIHDFTKDKGTSLHGLDCDRDWGGFHGNKVTSLVAKYSGTTPVRFVTLKVLPCDDDYSNAFWHVYDALEYVAKNHRSGPAVVNLSVSTEKFSVALDIPLRKLEKMNIPVVTAAGNYGGNACDLFSASSKRTITVGALNENFTNIWENSNTGPCVNYYAQSYHSCAKEGNKVVNCNSTSFAAPVVSGIIVSWLSANPKANIASTRSMLTKASKIKTVRHKGKVSHIRYLPTPTKIRF